MDIVGSTLATRSPTSPKALLAIALPALFLAFVSLVVVPVPAAAARRGPHTAGPIEGRLRSGRAEEQSTNWSGYAAYGQTFTEVQGSWVQPGAECGAMKGHQSALAAFWVGLDGYGNRTVEQIGTEADCEGTEEIYYAWYELYPERLFVIGEEVKPEDVIHARVTQGTLSLEDQTAGWTATEEFSPVGLEFSSAEWIAEAPFNRLTDFGAVGFTDASAATADATGPIGSWEADDVTLVANNGRHAAVLAGPSPLEAGGSAFTITQP
jgi:hypothetical protein